MQVSHLAMNLTAPSSLCVSLLGVSDPKEPCRAKVSAIAGLNQPGHAESLSKRDTECRVAQDEEWPEKRKSDQPTASSPQDL